MTSSHEAALVRRLDLRILPFIWLMYLVNFLDRVNLGNVHGPFLEDLGLTEQQYTLGVGVFFIGYIVFEIPSNLMLKRATPSKWLARIMVSWGIISVSMMFITDFAGLMVCRFLLGIMEAGFFPGIIFYLTFWYRKEEQALRQSIFITAITVAGALAGLLAFGLLKLDGLGGLAGWQYVFLIEGMPAILLGVACWFYLPDFPKSATFLTEEERALAVSRLDAHVHSEEFSKKEFVATMRDPTVWLFALIYMAVVNTLYAIVFFLPAIIEGLGNSPIISNLLTVPVYALATFTTVAFAYSSDKRRERPLHIVIASTITGIGMVLLAIMSMYGQSGLAYTACFIAAAGSFPSVVVTLAWLTNTIEGSTSAATSTALVVSFGNIGGFLIPQLLGFAKTQTGTYGWGMIVMTGITVIGIVLVFSLRWRLKRVPSHTSHPQSDEVGLMESKLALDPIPASSSQTFPETVLLADHQEEAPQSHLHDDL